MEELENVLKYETEEDEKDKEKGKGMKLGYLFKEGIKKMPGLIITMTIASIAVLVSCLLLTGSAVLFYESC